MPTSLKSLLAQYQARLRRPTRRELLLALATIPALILLYVLVLIPFTPSIKDIRKAKVDQPARILFADGKPLAEFKWANRKWVKLDEISPHVIDALIATEDRRFYQHHGIDFRRTAGAMLHTFSGDRQGGSTITQQLARNLYPDDVGRAPTLTRKVKEAITAIKIEALYTKPEILETYLNTVPFLYNAYGIEMAARTYFGKSADELDVPESATLVGMLKGNSYYNPVTNPERAQQRRNVVLEQMLKMGKLSPERLAVLEKKPLRIDFERQTEPPGPAPHFAVQVRKWLIEWADKNDYDIYADGLVVYTTLDSRLQAYAMQAVSYQTKQLQQLAEATWSGRDGWHAGQPLVQAFVRDTPEYKAAVAAGQGPEEVLKKLEADKTFMRNLRQQKLMVQAGFLAIDPRNAEVRAWVGSRDFTSSAFDHVAQARRQPGSTFKPFVYGAAFAHGASPDDTLVDSPVEYHLPGGEVWRPTDDSPPTGQAMTLRDGLVFSNNIITAQVMQRVGPSRVARLAQAMGVRDSKLDEVPSLALGTSLVSLREMVSAYGTIANDGGYREPRLVARIEDRQGKVLAEFTPPEAQQALDKDADRTLLEVMRGVVDRGTGYGIRGRFGIRADVAGKTGTTQDNTDGWFILMHPQLVAGAWVGFDDSRITMRSNYWGQGARSALPMVGSFFQHALAAKVIDAKVRFDTEHDQGWFQRLQNGASEWLRGLFAPAPGASAPVASASPAAASMPQASEMPVEAASQPAVAVPGESAPSAAASPVPAGGVPASGASMPVPVPVPSVPVSAVNASPSPATPPAGAQPPWASGTQSMPHATVQ